MIGLVLSGGGAKGAYQAGVLNYLVEIGFEPDIIAGASIGALNGAVLASIKPFREAVERLNELWDVLASEKFLIINQKALLQVASYGLSPFLPQYAKWLLDFIISEGLVKDQNSFFNPQPIEKLLRNHVDAQSLREGIEFWVTVFPALGIPGLPYDLLDQFANLLRAAVGTQSHWLRVQDFQDDETLYNVLLASAALPIAFPTREINGRKYIDGGLADNVPLKGLAARGCTHAVVIHLSNGSLWNRHNFKEINIIEIRPEKPIFLSTGIGEKVSSLLDFNANRILQLKQEGKHDAEKILNKIAFPLNSIRSLRSTQSRLKWSMQRLDDDEKDR